jgi:HTH-type transcriptional regulator / antitoxin HigA
MPQRSRRTAINAEEYTRLIAATLPIPPRTVTDNERLIAALCALDEREDLTAAEQAFAELLAIVIEDFEERHYALPKVTPQEALKALMEDRGLRHKDIAPIVGNKGLTTEILKGRRNISAALAKRLATALQVPVELFI